MSDTMIDSDLTTQEAPRERSGAQLEPGQSVTVYTGVEAATFQIMLTGTIQREADIAVIVDGATAATLTFDFRSTVANGTSIQVSNRGRVRQGVAASLIS